MVHRFYEEKRGSVAWEVVQLPRWFLRSLETDRFVCSPWGSHTHAGATIKQAGRAPRPVRPGTGLSIYEQESLFREDPYHS